MYNLNSHYENIFQYLNTIVTDPRLLYLIPYGSTQPENFEFLMNDLGNWGGDRGPLFVFYDQEPILGEFNYRLLDHVRDNFLHGHKFILITTEKNSSTVEQIQQRYNCPVVYYFHHVFAAHDWFRGVKFDNRLIPIEQRQLKKKYITFNRLTGHARVYRSLLISELVKRNILDQGYVSYSDVCPDGGTYQDHLLACNYIPTELANEAINNISKVTLPLRIDYKENEYIPNHSFVLSTPVQSQESFCYLVTETCYWEIKCHLTEKIFKPIVSRMPFVLVGPAHNLEYLRSYGFKTFSPWIDETYDTIEDPIERMTAIGKVMETICSRSLEELTSMLLEMREVLEHNYNLFYSQKFLDHCWNELAVNLKESFDPGDYRSVHKHVTKYGMVSRLT